MSGRANVACYCHARGAVAAPAAVMRSHSEYVAGKTLIDLVIENDLVAERIALGSRGKTSRSIADQDPTIRRMLASILAVAEEHADGPASRLTRV